MNSRYICHEYQLIEKVDLALTSAACLAGVRMCIGSLHDFLQVRDIKYDFSSLPLETELIGIELEQFYMAALGVECA